MGCDYNKWTVTMHQTRNQLKKILFLEFENFNFITCCARNISLDFNVIQLYFEIIFNLTRNFEKKYFGSHKNVGFFFNSVLSGCLKLLIVVLARNLVVLLTNCKWAVVNSIRIKKWVVHSYKSQMGYMFSAKSELWAYQVDAYQGLSQLSQYKRFQPQ